MTGPMIRMKPQNNGRDDRKWYQRPYMGVAAGTVAIAALALTLDHCSTKPKPPEPPTCPESKPAVCEDCCPPGHRKVVSKEQFGINIKCIDPLTEPRCPDGKCNGKETPETCPQDCKPQREKSKAAVRAQPEPVEIPEPEAPKEPDCTEEGAKRITAGEAPEAFRRTVRKVVENHSAALVGDTAEVTVLVCPKNGGGKGVYAQFVKVNVRDANGDAAGAGEIEKLTGDLTAKLDGKEDPNRGIPQVEIFTQAIQVKQQSE